MRPLYFLALIGTRLIGVLLMLILSHIMTPAAFGQFALINTNALAVQMVMGSWLVSVSNRAMVSGSCSIDRQMMAAILSATLIVSGAIIGTGLGYAASHLGERWQVLAIAALATALIVYDVTLAVKNAVGQESAYAAFAIYRNVLALLLALTFVALGSGPLGPVAAMILGTAFPLIFLPAARAIWTSDRPSWPALRCLKPYLGQGLAGGLVLGIYILVNAPTRNIMAQFFGKSFAGVWTLCADLFYGPLAVIGNAYALSQIRLIYLAAADQDDAAMERRTRALMECTLAIAVPYMIGCDLFAGDAARLILSPAQAGLAIDIAGPAAIQGAAVLILYSLTSIALAHRRFWLVAAMVGTVSMAATAGMLVGNSPAAGARLAMGGATGAVTFWLAWSAATRLVRLQWRELAKLAAASAALWTAAAAAKAILQNFGNGPAGWIAAALIGSCAFVAVAFWLRFTGFIDIIPSAVGRRMLHLTGDPQHGG